MLSCGQPGRLKKFLSLFFGKSYFFSSNVVPFTLGRGGGNINKTHKNPKVTECRIYKQLHVISYPSWLTPTYLSCTALPFSCLQGLHRDQPFPDRAPRSLSCLCQAEMPAALCLENLCIFRPRHGQDGGDVGFNLSIWQTAAPSAQLPIRGHRHDECPRVIKSWGPTAALTCNPVTPGQSSSRMLEAMMPQTAAPQVFPCTPNNLQKNSVLINIL